MGSTKGRIQSLINPKLLQSSAYKVQDSSGMIKLDAMENPFPLSKGLNSSVSASLKALPLNRYPDPEAKALKKALKQYWSLSVDQPMILGNGSDELIQLILIALLGKEKRVVMSVQPSFVMYRLLAEALGFEFVGVDLDEHFEPFQDTFLAAIEKHQPSVIFLAQPNNPTGNLFSEQTLKAVLTAAPGLVVIDEAYGSFSTREHLSWLKDYDDLLVMRTLSKIGLAGLRIGALMASLEWVEQLNKARLPYNLNVLSQVAAQNILSYPQVFNDQIDLLKFERKRLAEYFSQTGKWQVFPSEANFILIRSIEHNASDIFNNLVSQGVLVKILHGVHPLLDQCLRITVGAVDENDALMKAIS